ncbi:hypothetical protein AC1031_016627 [Aphanomyces cochlioides]|nr:hypothetical protein AC1031_016627 [Aphanomyces cochlioides]
MHRIYHGQHLGSMQRTAEREDATRGENADDEASSEDSSADSSDGEVKDMSLVYISEDEDNDGQLDEKTLEMREKNRADRERRERHKIEKYGPDFRRAESDSSVTSLSGEDTDEYKERNYQKAQAKKAEKEAKEQRTDATQSSNVFNSGCDRYQAPADHKL